jgi:DNA-binding beta-propeller fold protein YncE
MRSTVSSVGRVTRLPLIVTAIAIACLSGTSAGVLATFDSPTLEGAHRHGKRDRPNGTVWVVNRDLGQLAIFDAGTGNLLKTLPVGAGAHDICISERVHRAYITAEANNAVTAVDTETLVTESIPVSPLPHHIEPSHDGRTIYVSLASHPLPGAAGAPRYAAIDTRDHSVTYMTTSHNPAARSHGVTPDRDKLYVAHDTGNEVTGIDLETGDIDFSIPNIPRAEEVVASKFGDELWVSARGDNSVKRIDLDTQTITASVPVGVQPESMMLTPSERTLVLSLRGSPASLGFVNTRSVDTGTPTVQVIPIAGTGTFGDLAVMAQNGRYVFATFDRGLPPNKGGVVVVDVRTRQIVNSWEYPGEGRPHGIWYSKKAARF